MRKPGTGCPVTSKNGRTPPNKHGGVGRQQQHQQQNGNLAFFVDWKAKYDSDLADHLRFARKAEKYTSPQIQNEIISLYEREIRHNIVFSDPPYRSILADETQDCGTVCFMSVVVTVWGSVGMFVV